MNPATLLRSARRLRIGLPALVLLALLAGSAGCLPRAGWRKHRPIPPEAPVVKVAVTAERYKFTPDTIRVPEGCHAVVELTSLDVTQGFALEDYGVNVLIPAKSKATAEFYADRPGTFPFRCSHFCGFGYLKMKGRLIVEPKPEDAPTTPPETAPEPAAPPAGQPEPPGANPAPPQEEPPPPPVDEEPEPPAPPAEEPAPPAKEPPPKDELPIPAV